MYNDINIFLTGDFNIIPNSGLYKFIIDQKMYFSCLNKKDRLSNQIYANKLSSE
jgi:hypothetical protein